MQLTLDLQTLWQQKKTNSDLTDDDVFNGVAKFPVTKFMTEDSQDLWIVAALFLDL